MRVRFDISVAAIYLAIAIGLTWPMARHLSSAVPDLGDPLLTSWILDWVGHALTHAPLRLYDAPMFHPSHLPLAYSENLIAVGLLVLPLQIAGVGAVALNNIALLLGFALSGYGAYVLARRVSGSEIGAFIAGLLYAFAPYKFDHLSHLQIVFSAWVPLTLAALLAFWERATWKRGAWLAALILLHGLTNIYYLMFCGVACAFTVLLLALRERRDVRFYGTLAAAVLAGGLILVPFLLPYRAVSAEYKMVRDESEARSYSASAIDWIVPSARSRAWGDRVSPQLFGAERQLFPGALFVALALVACGFDLFTIAALFVAWLGAIGDRAYVDEALMIAVVLALIRFTRTTWARVSFEAQAAAVWVIVGFLGSFGPKVFLYEFFYRYFSPFQAMRGPARFAVVAYAGLAVFAAIGVKALLERTRWRHAVAVLLVVLALVEVIPKIRWERAPVAPTPLHRWLARNPIGPLLELPVAGNAIEFQYLLGSTHHHVPMVNGTSGFLPPANAQAIVAEQRGAYDEVLAVAERWGVRALVVHGDSIAPAQRDALSTFLGNATRTQRLAFLGRFDRGVHGDYLFALPRNFATWQRFRAPDVPDAAGHLPQQQLQRFLDKQTTHSNSIVIVVEAPQPHIEAYRALHVHGWALSPHGVRRATIDIALGKRRIDASLVPRDDVKRAYPWAYLDAKPGFDIVIPKRPKGVPRSTTIAVEIEDHAGRIARSPDILLTWQ